MLLLARTLLILWATLLSAFVLILNDDLGREGNQRHWFAVAIFVVLAIVACALPRVAAWLLLFVGVAAVIFFEGIGAQLSMSLPPLLLSALFFVGMRRRAQLVNGSVEVNER